MRECTLIGLCSGADAAFVTALDLSELVTVHHDASADHMFSALRHRRMVVETTENRMIRPSTAPAVEAKLAAA